MSDNEWKDLATKWEALATASVSDALGWKRRASAAEERAHELREENDRLSAKIIGLQFELGRCEAALNKKGQA